VKDEYPIVILGGGVAALTAAVQVSQAGFQPLVITGPSPGGNHCSIPQYPKLAWRN
jgi:thioredoxin reductase